MKAAGMAYLKRAIEMLRTQVLGMPPSPETPSASDNTPASQRPRSYTQALLDRFQLPQGRWPGNAGSAGQDFYNFLTSAVSAATGSTNGAGGKEEPNARSNSLFPGGGVGAFPAGGGGGGGDIMTASGTLVPPSIRDDAAKMSFLAAQRERLNLVLTALDREAAALRSASPPTATAAAAVPLVSPGVQGINLDSVQSTAASSSSVDRPATSASGRSGLSKSRSEADFEKIEAESDAENNPAQDSDSARPTPAATAGGGSWMPWGWGGSAPAKEDKSKAE